MVKHSNNWSATDEELLESVFDHFVESALKGSNKFFFEQKNFTIPILKDNPFQNIVPFLYSLKTS